MIETKENLKKKVLSIFNNKGILIDKRLSRLSDRFKSLPGFVSDYLVNALVDPDDPTPGLSKIEKIMIENYSESNQTDLIKAKIRSAGEYSILGQLKCRYDQSRDSFWAEIPSIGDQYIRIDPIVINEHGDSLLSTGAWGTTKVVFDDSFSIRNKKYPFYVLDFKPLQITKIDVDDWIEKRNHFSTEEWIDLIISTIGFSPDKLSKREKMLYLIRLIPFIESNTNFVELGATETGKTYFYRYLSSHSFVLSGAKTTIATLFYDKLRRKQGILCNKDCIMFDEISHTNWRGEEDLINMLKDFMNNGRFGRGSDEFSSQCSIVFAGNIDCDRDKKAVKGYYRHLFCVLPQIIQNDRAFLDRINGFIPGWEMPQISESAYSNEVGFMADYFSEIMHRMRMRSYNQLISENIDFGNMGIRNQNSITKNASGLLKLIFPHRTPRSIEKEELKLVLDESVSLRNLVLDQLKIILPSEFKQAKLEYSFK